MSDIDECNEQNGNNSSQEELQSGDESNSLHESTCGNFLDNIMLGDEKACEEDKDDEDDKDDSSYYDSGRLFVSAEEEFSTSTEAETDVDSNDPRDINKERAEWMISPTKYPRLLHCYPRLPEAVTVQHDNDQNDEPVNRRLLFESSPTASTSVGMSNEATRKKNVNNFFDIKMKEEDNEEEDGVVEPSQKKKKKK